MGSLPRLPDKIKYKYRKGHTNEAQNCKACANFIKDFEVRGGMAGAGHAESMVEATRKMAEDSRCLKGKVIDLLEMALSGSGAPDDVQAPMIAH